MHASRVLEVEHGTFTPLVFTTTGGKIYRQHETEKKMKHASRVLEVEHGTFTPLVFTTTCGLVWRKKGEEYSTTISWIRTYVSFAILRSEVRAHQGVFAQWTLLTETLILINNMQESNNNIDITVHRSCPF